MKLSLLERELPIDKDSALASNLIANTAQESLQSNLRLGLWKKSSAVVVIWSQSLPRLDGSI
jgi:hypothetical protein